MFRPMATGTPCPASRAVLTQATELFPTRSTRSDGLVASDSHSAQNPSSDHEPDSRGITHAADLTDDPPSGCDVFALFAGIVTRVLAGLERRLKYAIRDREIFNPAIAPYWRRYTGSNPHVTHGHLSILTAYENDVSPWYGDGGGDLMPGDADRIIDVIGRYEQDSRRMLIGVMERIADDAREREGRRTRRILEAIEASSAGQTEKVAALLQAEADDPVISAAESATAFVADMEKIAGDLDDRFMTAPSDVTGDEEKAQAFVEEYRADLAGLAAK